MPSSRKSHGHVFTRTSLAVDRPRRQSGVLHTKQRRQPPRGVAFTGFGPIFSASKSALARSRHETFSRNLRVSAVRRITLNSRRTGAFPDAAEGVCLYKPRVLLSSCRNRSNPRRAQGRPPGQSPRRRGPLLSRGRPAPQNWICGIRPQTSCKPLWQ